MREILFKAKRLDNGEWVKGDLGQDKDLEKYYISGWNYYTADSGLEREPYLHEVYASTVCQYIGIRDRNNDRIFENDIIRFVDYRGKTRELPVTWNPNHGVFCVWVDGATFYGVNKYLSNDIVVIGNINDAVGFRSKK